MIEGKQTTKILFGTMLVLGVMIIYLLLKLNPTTTLPQLNTKSTSLIPIFLTGLITGGLTCLAVQGGLLASTIAMQEEDQLKSKSKKQNNVLPIASFLVTKLIAYTIFGFLLGSLGSLFQLSLTAQVIMQTVVIVFMLGTALNILEVHPIFRYFAIQPPKFLLRKIRNQSKSKSIFAPAILGAFTVFIPCGTTQAMMALAIGSGKPVTGALILFAFILGTTPLFFILGFLGTMLGDAYQKKFLKIAAMALILLAFFNTKNTLSLAGVNFKLSLPKQEQVESPITDRPTIEFLANGYSPNNISVAAGSNVTLTLKNKNGAGCIQSFVIPSLGVQKIVQVGSSTVVNFQAPDKEGQLAFMCGMGMYRGIINIKKV